MAALSEAVKSYIVERIAVYDTPTQIVKAIKEDLDVVITRQHVWTYDPTKASNATRVSKRLRTLFEATRARFLDEVGDIAIANKAVRLHRLDRMALAAEESKNYVLTASLMEQAAKECGGAFTNRHELTGANGRPLVPTNAAPELSTDEKKRRVTEAFAIARRRKAAVAAVPPVARSAP